MFIPVCDICQSKDVFVTRSSTGEPGRWRMFEGATTDDMHACGSAHARELDAAQKAEASA